MKAYIQLTLAQLKLFARNRSVIFWTTFFPLFLMIMLGLFLGGGDTTASISLGWLDEEGSDVSKSMRESFEQVEAVQVKEYENFDLAMEDIEGGKITFLIQVPEDFSEHIEQQDETAKLAVYYNEVDQSLAQLGFAVVDQIVDGINKEYVQFEETVQVEHKGIRAVELSYLDFLVPGIAALMILSSNLNGVAAQIASWRERGILRRMKSTGLPASTFIAAQITARMVLNLSQSILVILIGIFVLGAQMNGNVLLLLFYLILGILVFMSLGFIIASLAKTPEHAAPIAGFISFPMFFLGGIFFPLTNMPDFLKPVITIIPISHLSNVLREVMNLGATMADLWLPTSILLGWFLVSFTLAAKFFKWE